MRLVIHLLLFSAVLIEQRDQPCTSLAEQSHGGDRKSALVVQALRHLGKDGVDDRALSVLRSSLSDSERKQLLKNTRLGVDWIYGVAKKLVEVHS